VVAEGKRVLPSAYSAHVDAHGHAKEVDAMVRLRRIGIISAANVAAVLYALVILFFTVIVAILALFAGPNIRQVQGAPDIGAAGAVGVLIAGLIFALFYAVFGWIFTAIAVWLYNVVAGITGGVQMHLESLAPPAAVAWPAGTPPPPPAVPPGGSPPAPTV
jgi:hypothetical protein